MNPKVFTEADKIWRHLAKDANVAELQFELEVHKKLLNIFQVGDYYYFVFNVKDAVFDLMSEEVRDVLGYEPKTIDVPFFLGNIHPDDQPWFLNFENKVAEFFAALTPQQIPNYKVRYDYRIKRSDGSYIRVLQQVITIDHDGVNVIRTFGVHTDITHIKQDGIPLLSFIGMNGEPSYINVDVKNVFAPASELLTIREKEILSLIIAGNDSKDISNALFISKLTVDTHRKNLLKKFNCANTAALISYTIKKGLI